MANPYLINCLTPLPTNYGHHHDHLHYESVPASQHIDTTSVTGPFQRKMTSGLHVPFAGWSLSSGSIHTRFVKRKFMLILCITSIPATH